MTIKTPPRIARLARIGLTTQHAASLAGFYEQAFGFRQLKSVTQSGADDLWLGLGDQIVELTQFATPGRPYPGASSASDLIFQHFAIVVTDMAEAYRRLSAVAGWIPISRNGPQTLPQSSGGVSAFKFRDPEGHPLELLSYPAGGIPERWRRGKGADKHLCLGIDHTAISVRDAERSITFYEKLGLRLAARTFNHGPEQSGLDGLDSAEVDVVALNPQHETPHLELLCYRSVAGHMDAGPLAANDVAASRLIFASENPSPGAEAETRLIDPDGHHLVIA